MHCWAGSYSCPRSEKQVYSSTKDGNFLGKTDVVLKDRN